MEILEFQSRPRSVRAIQITAANMDEVSAWCGGEIVQDGLAKYIKVPAHRPQNQRQKEGRLDDWIVKQGSNFKVFLDPAFRASFEPKVKGVHVPSALDQKYVRADTEASPIFESVHKDRLSTSDRRELKETLPANAISPDGNLVGVPKDVK